MASTRGVDGSDQARAWPRSWSAGFDRRAEAAAALSTRVVSVQLGTGSWGTTCWEALTQVLR